MMTREEMEVIASNPEDPNFHLLNKMYKEFDNELFAFNSPQYDDWAELALTVDLGCYLQIGIASDGLNDISYVVCSSECINDLLNSGLVDDIEETIWVKGNCAHASVIDQFLEDYDTPSTNILNAASTFLSIGIAEIFTITEFREFINQFQLVIDNSENEDILENFFQYLIENDINILALSPYELKDENALPDVIPPVNQTGWTDMKMGDFLNSTNSIRSELEAEYPGQIATINTWFRCRVLGTALEAAALNSLGAPLNNTQPTEISQQPDAFTTVTFEDFLTFHEQPNIFEIKGRFNGLSEDIFPYDESTQQINQFQGYRNYLSNPEYTHKPTTTIVHGLTIILPANVFLSDNVIDACSDLNIRLVYMNMQRKANNPLQVRVGQAFVLNMEELNHSGHIATILGDAVLKWFFEKSYLPSFGYSQNEVTIDYQSAADAFEASYLQSFPTNPECAD